MFLVGKLKYLLEKEKIKNKLEEKRDKKFKKGQKIFQLTCTPQICVISVREICTHSIVAIDDMCFVIRALIYSQNLQANTIGGVVS